MSTTSNKRKSEECHQDANHEEPKKVCNEERKDEAKKDRYPTVTNAICHIDIPASNMKRIQDFFTTAFGWTIKSWKDEYCLWSGGGSQCISGGIYFEKQTTDKLYVWPPKRSFLLHIYAQDIPSALNAVHKAGGIVIKPRYLIAPNIGCNGLFFDTEGNQWGIYNEKCDDVVEVKDIEQTVSLKGSPHVIYEKLMDEKLHTAFVGKPSQINRNEGGEFKISEEYITGRNILLESDHKIVQSWRAADWPSGHFSIVTFTLTADAKTKGTTMTMKHEYVPVAHFEHISKGWYDYYWNKIDA
jgi:predicted enzyme related to lactoylglutathione lyase/uncharacterized protein YndB with AHSA1/START domain